ncbi:MAG: RnfABCDGE type electron transport complex subunit A [Bacteroidales bacterium]|nr:RnfABCDGE type electron transport complex subunit A [Bacteroidales bacterium]
MGYILIFITAIFVNNVVLSQFLGICPFLGVSKKVETASGMAAAVAFVLVIATLVTYLLQIYFLDPATSVMGADLRYLQTIVFILVIAALVQMVEIVLKKVSPSLYQALGVFLPLITTNCCILGVAIQVAQGTFAAPGLDHNLLTGIWYAFSTALGFGLALVVFAGIREQLSRVAVPKGVQGMSIALITAGLLAMAFMGFSGVNNGLEKLFGI